MEDTYIHENQEEYEKLRDLLKIEIDNIVLDKWNFLNKDWCIINKKFKHRTELKEVRDIGHVKNRLKNKLGHISIFYFLNELFTNCEYPGPYLEIDKGLLLVYHLLEGLTHSEINKDHMPSATFSEIYKRFWVANYDILNKKVDEALLKMFSNIKIRILSSKIKSPKHFKHVTMMLDGHDTRLDYNKIDVSKLKKWSYKLKTSGIRTQVLIDINEMVIACSKSQLCGDSADGPMFLNMKIYNKIHNSDCIALDGGYPLFLNQFYELCITKGYELSDKNFIYPIRKEIGIDLNAQEVHFNKVFGKYRNTVENQFRELTKTFKRFSKNNSIIKTNDYKYINLQLKTALLLRNIKRFSEKFNIITQPHHKLWENSHFEYPSEKKLIDIVFSNEMETMNKIAEIEALQNKIFDININSDDNNDIAMPDLNDSDEDFPNLNKNNSKKRKYYKNKKAKHVNDISKLRDTTNKDNTYEIEKIVSHKIENKIYKFFIKWQGYDETENSWINLDSFDEKDLLIEYLEEKQILIPNINM